MCREHTVQWEAHRRKVMPASAAARRARSARRRQPCTAGVPGWMSDSSAPLASGTQCPSVIKNPPAGQHYVLLEGVR